MNNHETIIKELENLNERIGKLKDELVILEKESFELELKLLLDMRNEKIKCDKCAEVDCYKKKGGKIDCKMFSPKGKY